MTCLTDCQTLLLAVAESPRSWLVEKESNRNNVTTNPGPRYVRPPRHFRRPRNETYAHRKLVPSGRRGEHHADSASGLRRCHRPWDYDKLPSDRRYEDPERIVGSRQGQVRQNHLPDGRIPLGLGTTPSKHVTASLVSLPPRGCHLNRRATARVAMTPRSALASRGALSSSPRAFGAGPASVSW